MLAIIIVQFGIIICMYWWTVRTKAEVKMIENVLENVIEGNIDRQIVIKNNSCMAELCFKINVILENCKQIITDKTIAEKENKALMTSLSHDIRTPLTSIIGYLDAMIYLDENQELSREFIETARRKAYLLKQYVDNLFQWFKLNSKEQQFNLKKIEVVELTKIIFANWIETFEQYHMEYEFVNDIETAYVVIDETAFERIVNNLIQNVLEHSGASIIKIGIQKEKENIRLSVEDNGIGISATDQKRIFERLYKGDVSRSKKGSGLGLAITRKLIDALKGEIHVESEEGMGTKFILQLECTKDLLGVCETQDPA